jgi:L-alanine-DL-glutamate epimerase-like enolase superfamily enzyme
VNFFYKFDKVPVSCYDHTRISIMSATAIRIRDCALYYIPLETRTPLQFGRSVVRELECLRVEMTVETADGGIHRGWGETPLNVAWAWPEAGAPGGVHPGIRSLCSRIARAWRGLDGTGSSLELGAAFLDGVLPGIWQGARGEPETSGVPWQAVLLCAASFDLALHDAFGKATALPTYRTYTAGHLASDLSPYFADEARRFRGKYPADYFATKPPKRIPVWHLVGCADVVEGHEAAPGEKTRAPREAGGNGAAGHRAAEAADAGTRGFPVTLREWIRRDGIKRLKVKLCGSSLEWDSTRVRAVGRLTEEAGAEALFVDFNGTAPDADYVLELLSRLSREAPEAYRLLRYVEQPFAPGTEVSHDDLQRITAHKPVFLDESATTWRDVRRAFHAGYSGVVLKTCKTQTSAMLSLAWAREHRMEVAVADLSNPMLAQIPHVLLGAHASPELGVESNSMQFYPDASAAEAKVHPGVYRRRDGMLDLSSISGPGFGYRIEEIERRLPERAA